MLTKRSDQKNEQYVELASLMGDEGKLIRKVQLKRWAEMQEAKRAGKPCPKKLPATGKMQRVHTYVDVLNLANMLEGMGSSLSKFQILPDADGNLPCPFTWDHINLSTDRGAPCVCMDHALAYKFQLNNHTDFDPHHGTQRVQVGSLKEVGRWPHQVFVLLRGRARAEGLGGLGGLSAGGRGCAGWKPRAPFGEAFGGPKK